MHSLTPVRCMCRQAQLVEDQKRVLDERVAALWKERTSLMEQIKVDQAVPV